MPPTIPNLDSDFNRLIAAFRAIAKIDSPLRKRFTLIKISSYFGVPRSEFRKLYQLWLDECTEAALTEEVEL